MPRTLYPVLVVAILVSPPLHPEEPLRLPPMLIEVTRDPSEWLATPAPVTQVDADNLPAEQGLALDSYLAPVPGVFTLNRYNAAQGLRPSIRGFGARAGFGVRGLRVLVDGVPLTLPDGQTELDALDLGLIERIEVLRGPASALYGNAAGGVISLFTRAAPTAPALGFDVGAGEHGERHARAEAGGGNSELRGLGAISLRELGGFRDHSAADSEIASGKLHWDQAIGRLTLNFNALEVESQDPGGLTATEVRARRRDAAPNNLRFDAGEEIRQQRLALVWETTDESGPDYSLRAWGGQREFANRLPFMAGGQSSFDRDFGGLGGQLAWQGDWLGLSQRLIAGLDIEAQRDDRRRHDNLQGARGAETLHQRESATGAGIFIEDNFTLGERWLASAGLRRDRLKFDVEDRFFADGDNSGARRLDETSYHFGLGYHPDDAHFIYARVGSAFESPTIAELANPAGGGFNPDLEPAQALNHELGLKGERDALRYELAVFSTQVDDELLRFELPAQPGRSFFRNAGRSRREGVELSADWALTRQWRVNASYTHADYRFERYVLNGIDFSGNEIPGFPRQQLFTELSYRNGGGYVRFNLLALDRLYADDANQVRVAGHVVANLRLGFTSQANPRWEPYLGINNIFGSDYNDNIRINAGGQRYFEPAPGATAYAGLKARW